MATQESEVGPEHYDSVSDELESMRRIAKALDALHDDTTRQRVLQWANDRYHGTGATAVAPQPAAVMQVATDDPNLAVEELDDLFDPAVKVGVKAAPRTPQQHASVESMIKDFAADFRRFALEWQGA